MRRGKNSSGIPNLIESIEVYQNTYQPVICCIPLWRSPRRNYGFLSLKHRVLKHPHHRCQTLDGSSVAFFMMGLRGGGWESKAFIQVEMAYETGAI